MSYQTWAQERQSYNEWMQEFTAKCTECQQWFDVDYMIGPYCAYCYGKEGHAEKDTSTEDTRNEA